MLKDLWDIAKDSGVGLWGFIAFALFMVLVYGWRRTSTFAAGLNGGFAALIEQGEVMRKALREELNASAMVIAQQREQIALQKSYITELQEEIVELQHHLALLKEACDDPADLPRRN